MGTVSMPLDVSAARFDTVNTPEFVYITGTNGVVDGPAFPQNTAKFILFNLKPLQYGGGSLTLNLNWYSRSGSTSGNVTLSAEVAAITPATDTTSVEAKAFDTAHTATVAARTSAKAEQTTSFTLTNLDSLANGDDLWIKVKRTDVSMVGDCIIVNGDLSYSDGNSGTPGSGDVVGPASATNEALVRFDATTGKLVKNSTVVCDASGNLTGLGTLNTRTPANLADGAASSTTGNIASFSGTSGKVLQDSGVSATAHAARHLPGGADTVFSGTWTADSEPVWSGSAFVPKYRKTIITAGGAGGNTSLTAISGLQFTLPRAGTYVFSYNVACTISTTATIAIAANATNFTAITATGIFTTAASGVGVIGAQVANNTAAFSASRNITTVGMMSLAGQVTVSAAATLDFMVLRSTGTLTISANSGGFCHEL